MAILKKKRIEFEFCRCWLHVEGVEELTRAALKRPPLVAEVVIVCLLSCSSILVAVHVVAFVVVTGSCTAVAMTAKIDFQFAPFGHGSSKSRTFLMLVGFSM